MPRPCAAPATPLTPDQQRLVEGNLNLAEWVVNARRKRITCLTEEDLHELAWIGLCMATKYHDKQRGRFSTIAVVAMNSMINIAVKAQHRQKRKPAGLALSLDERRAPAVLNAGLDDVDIEDWLECTVV